MPTWLLQNLLKTEYKEDLPLSEVVPLLVKVLSKSMDSSLSADKVELATLTRDEASGEVRNRHVDTASLGILQRRVEGNGLSTKAAACVQL